MPVAAKYTFTMRIPDAGGSVGGFSVESCQVGCEEHGDGTIDYPVSMVLAGPGGKQGVRKAIRDRFSRGRTTFSGFGNPYQLHFGRFEVESLGGSRYRVTACGKGVRIDLERELRRFLAWTRLRGKPADDSLTAAYLEDYTRDITRKNPELEY
jgi:hypothetical protein